MRMGQLHLARGNVEPTHTQMNVIRKHAPPCVLLWGRASSNVCGLGGSAGETFPEEERRGDQIKYPYKNSRVNLCEQKEFAPNCLRPLSHT